MKIFTEKQWREEVYRIQDETERRCNQWQRDSRMEEMIRKMQKELDMLKKKERAEPVDATRPKEY